MILPSGNSTGLRGFRLRLGRQEGLSVMAGCNMASGAVRLSRDARWLGSGLRHQVLVRDFPFGLSFRSRMATGYHGVGQARSAVGAAETQIDDRDVAASSVEAFHSICGHFALNIRKLAFWYGFSSSPIILFVQEQRICENTGLGSRSTCSMIALSELRVPLVFPSSRSRRRQTSGILCCVVAYGARSSVRLPVA